MRFALVVASLVLVADYLSKAWILNDVMAPPRVVEVTSFFNLVLTFNRGISFGLFGGQAGPWLFIAVALAIVAVLLVWLWRGTSARLSLALGLVIGGALGNVVDRLRFGAVVDFLDFHVAGYHWPAFNLADSTITIGVLILIADSLFDRSGRDGPRQTRDGR